MSPLVTPSTTVIWIFTILLLPQLSLQEEGHLHPTELSLLTESLESATWEAEHEEGDGGGREVETRGSGWPEGSSNMLTMMIFDAFDKGGDNGGDRNVVLLVCI